MPATNLSVNLNKIALLRNARQDNWPNLKDAARVIVEAGAQGLTLHPRADARHATLADVKVLANLDAVRSGAAELNVEGDLRPDLIETIMAVMPTQFTVVPVEPGEITSERGWRSRDDQAGLKRTVALINGRSRVSVFADVCKESIELIANAGADAVEFYTGPYAVNFGNEIAERELEKLENAASYARSLGLRVHCGHDLNRKNLTPLLDRISPDEVSIGHALVGDAVFEGLSNVVRSYLACIDERQRRHQPTLH